MSKPDSGHFKGTRGSNFRRVDSNASLTNDIIASKRLDLREHPTKYKQMNSKKVKQFREKVENRTITKSEYKRLNWQERLTARRNAGINEFWKHERDLIEKSLPTTRNWSAQQRKDILSGHRPKYKGKSMASHHKYSVAKYPHLANRGELIYPVTYYEHVYGWHGGNTKQSKPGVPIKWLKEF